MKIYLASWFASQPKMQRYADELRLLGYEVVSRWLTEKTSLNCQVNDYEDDYMRLTAEIDVEDIDKANVFIVFIPSDEEMTKLSLRSLSRGGRHWETGYAYASGKRIIICGLRENIFHFLDDVEWCLNWKEVKQALLESA